MISASVPVRICDNGGWTDTWFGGPGRVLNIAVTPGVRVDVRETAGPNRVVLDLETFGDRYAIVPGEPRVARHPLPEAAIDLLPPPGDLAVEVVVRSAVPPGCGVGTSAAVTVALVGALSALRGEPRSPREVAYAAHGIEVGVLGAESGIQDQLCAAFGGINYIEIERYPEATVRRLPVWDELGSRLTTIYLGRAHDSSAVHRDVIDSLADLGPGGFERLRDAAVAARDAVLAQDLDAFGRAMIDNTDAQRSLHPKLVGEDAGRLIELAAARDALGWKVNGAGGDGGSVTFLSAHPRARVALERDITASDARYRVLARQISPDGLRVDG